MLSPILAGSGARTVIRGGAYLAGSSWVEALLGFAYVAVITHYLGAERYGIWAFACATYGFAIGLVGMGIETLAPIRLGSRQQSAARFVGAALLLRLALLFLAGAVLAAYALAIEPDEDIRRAIMFLIPALAGRGLSLWARFVLLGLGGVDRHAKLASGMRALEVLLGSILLSLGGDLGGILLVHAAVWLSEGILAVLLISRVVPFRLRHDPALLLELLRQGSVLGLAAALINWLHLSPLLLLRHFGGRLEDVGQLALALQVTALLTMTTQAFFAAALPGLSRSFDDGDTNLAGYARVSAGLTIAGCSVVVVLAFFFGEAAMSLAFGAEFALAGRLLGPCLLIVPLVVAPTGYGQMLVLRGKRWPGVFASLAGGATVLAAFQPAAWAFGVYGAPVAALLGWGVRGAVLVIRARTDDHATTAIAASARQGRGSRLPDRPVS